MFSDSVEDMDLIVNKKNYDFGEGISVNLEGNYFEKIILNNGLELSIKKSNDEGEYTLDVYKRNLQKKNVDVSMIENLLGKLYENNSLDNVLEYMDRSSDISLNYEGLDVSLRYNTKFLGDNLYDQSRLEDFSSRDSQISALGVIALFLSPLPAAVLGSNLTDAIFTTGKILFTGGLVHTVLTMHNMGLLETFYKIKENHKLKKYSIGLNALESLEKKVTKLNKLGEGDFGKYNELSTSIKNIFKNINEYELKRKNVSKGLSFSAKSSSKTKLLNIFSDLFFKNNKISLEDSLNSVSTGSSFESIHLGYIETLNEKYNHLDINEPNVFKMVLDKMESLSNEFKNGSYNLTSKSGKEFIKKISSFKYIQGASNDVKELLNNNSIGIIDHVHTIGIINNVYKHSTIESNTIISPLVKEEEFLPKFLLNVPEEIILKEKKEEIDLSDKKKAILS